MKKFSPVFVTALMGMSIITHAYAEPMKMTQEEIERLYIDEVKLPGKTLQCYQAGKEIIHEVGLQSFEQAPGRITAKRLDGSTFEVLLFEGAEMACTVITRKPAE